MSALLLLLLLGAAPDGGVDAPRAVPDVLGAMKGFIKKGGGHEGLTACSACHATSSWTDVRFNHERTGFSLTGRHARTTCKACHRQDFSVPLPRGCAACHRDVHAGELGARCENCHDTQDWRSRFDVDAHRRTNFPLVGAHAALPCVECHTEARERRFTRSTVECQACHQNDLLRTSGAMAAVNHLALGLDQQNCRTCHTPMTFKPARFPTHDECFPISVGPHANKGCYECHDVNRPLSSTMGKCSTGTARCTHCHLEAETREQHPADRAPGYVWQDRRCLDCHYPRTGRLP